METIRIVFSRAWYQPFSLAVRALTWSNYSHCGIMLDDNTVIESTFLNGGVKIATFDEFKKRATAWEIREYDVKDAAAIMAAAKSQINRPYNWIALLGILFHVGSWLGRGTWFCSEFIAFAFWKAGQPLFNEQFVARIVPQFLWMLPSRFVASSNG